MQFNNNGLKKTMFDMDPVSWSYCIVKIEFKITYLHALSGKLSIGLFN